MSNIFNQNVGRTAATTQPKAMGIDLQGAQYGPPIPVVYGQNRVPGNVIWYGDFKSYQHTQKVGKGFGGATSTSYTYTASYLNGLCEGPIQGIVQVWSGNSIVLLSTLAPFSANGSVGQAPWSALPSPANLGYNYTALFGVDNMNLGGSPTLPNYNYEVAGLQQYKVVIGSGSIVDANPADIVTDICTNANHGIGFNALGSLTQYSDYCVANSLFLSPVYDQQSTALQALTDLFRATNTYVYFSEGQLKVSPLGDVAVTGNGVTYTPNVTPLFNLGPSDFIQSGNNPVVEVLRKAPQDCYNSVSVQFVDRSNSYHNSAQFATIDEDMIANGARMAQMVNVNGCVSPSVARFIAQNMVQRAYYVRNHYKFKLSFRYILLEPTDIVTLTDASTGLNAFPVRILEVAEDADGLLDITAEEFPEGIGHSALYNTQPNAGTNLDPMVDPGPVNAPAFFRMPGFLVGNGNPEIGIAVCGSGASWGGADIYLSHDGTSYTYAGSVNAPARYGTLTSDLPQPPPADPDTTTTLGVQLYAPGDLAGGTQADADNLVTLCLAGTELFAYETATLTAPNTYNLTYLRRNAYGTSNPATVGVGEDFIRIDDAIYRMAVDPSLIGSTIYVKFLSVNVFGKTPRTLAEETAYTYVVGQNVELPDVPPTPTNFAATAVADGVNLTWTNPVPAAVSQIVIYKSANPSNGFFEAGSVGPTQNWWTDHYTDGATWYYYIIARGPLPSSGFSAATATISSAGKTVADGATVGATLGTNLVQSNGTTVVSNLDQFPDGTTFQRVRALALQNGVPPLQTTGKNMIANGTFVSNAMGTATGASFTNGEHLVDGWDAFGVSPNNLLLWEAGTSPYGAHPFFGLRSGSVPASGNAICWIITTPNFPVSPGQQFTLSAHFNNANNTTIAGLSLNVRLGVRWFKSDGTSSSVVESESDFAVVWGDQYPTLPVTAPSDAATGLLYVGQTIYNNTGSAIAITGLPFDTRCYMASCVSVNNLDTEVADGNNYARLAALDSTPVGGVNRLKLGVAGSGAQLGDLRQIQPVLAAGASPIWQNLSITYSAASGSPATATISVTAAQVLGLIAAGGLVSYNASSISETGTGGTNVTYYLYYIDPTYSGGTQTLYATTTSSTLRSQIGIVYVGSVTVAYPSSGSGSGSGGSGLCVADSMWINDAIQARDVLKGDVFDCVDYPTGQGKHQRRLLSCTKGSEQCVRITTDNGCSLVCSVSTPFDTPDGGHYLAPDMKGKTVLTDMGLAIVKTVVPVGLRNVVRMHLGGVSYAAGTDGKRRIYSHNSTSKP